MGIFASRAERSLIPRKWRKEDVGPTWGASLLWYGDPPRRGDDVPAPSDWGAEPAAPGTADPATEAVYAAAGEPAYAATTTWHDASWSEHWRLRDKGPW